ncbi:hypothetical protein HFP89_01860 [Wenzhouxiangella sp. XN79A]|uniref:RAMP superfamily CRISPR-associated protein n=1 Tax=Wenzhouxiangella sp. XN79A TaxID=2724193 RepID=UPI00144AD16F|nr:RAMP superfamily CRISPR-associated protein [Wenzhouxiangella sp. XN79A]NKI33909.1 hypothetical protein [Wenzhouxiangella sp. XN79A]
MTIDFLGFWHCGGGRGGGSVVDAVIHRDASGLPVVPGRHLKGLLREAVSCAESWQWEGFARGDTERLFGTRTETHGADSRAGFLRVGDGVLPAATQRYLAESEAGRKLVPALFRSLHSTAISPETGSALRRSLRGMEVVVPLKLEAPIMTIMNAGAEPVEWLERLEAALPLIRAVGAYRSRGLGRARLALEATE